MSTGGALPKPHALVLPLPLQGHINPLLRFSIQLALRGFIITFVNTESSHKRMFTTQYSQTGDPSEQLLVDIRFVTIPDGGAGRSVLAFIQGVERQRGLIETMIESSKVDLHPISCIITESFFPWTQDLANKQGIGRVIFWTASGTTLAITLRYKKTGKWAFTDHNINDDESEGFDKGGVRIRHSELLSTLPNQDEQRKLAHRLDGVEDAVCIAVNTFEELERFNLEVSSHYSIPIRYIGPLMPVEVSDSAQSKPIVSGNLFEEEGDCLHWLSKQKPASVLYVSFGSVTPLTTAQMAELASGIEESKQPFLWVARPDTERRPVYPEGFLERTRGRGLVIAWAPQLKVLEHSAIAAFVTHCGWNSTTESLYMGVPMLCLPLTADQPLNELLISRQWKAGMAMAKGEDGLVRKEEFVKAVKTMMESQELRDESTRWKVMARQALMEGGSSHTAYTNLIADVQSFRPNIAT